MLGVRLQRCTKSAVYSRWIAGHWSVTSCAADMAVSGRQVTSGPSGSRCRGRMGCWIKGMHRVIRRHRTRKRPTKQGNGGGRLKHPGGVPRIADQGGQAVAEMVFPHRSTVARSWRAINWWLPAATRRGIGHRVRC